MKLERNDFKRRLEGGVFQRGLWHSLASPYAAEVVAGAGADWMVVDAEHSPLTIETTLAVLQVLAAYRVSPVVRPPWNDRVAIKQLLDIGASTLLLPYVQSAEEAQDAVQWSCYPPIGSRGMASGVVRASRFGRMKDYVARCDDEICLVAQIETKRALANLDSIACVDGIDALFVGPADLAADLGYPGQPGHPDVVEVVEDTIRRIVSAGKAVGVLAPDAELAKRYRDAGATFIALGVDIAMLGRTCEIAVRKLDKK